MVSYKLDKYDKYFVAFILVILVIFNIGRCFASDIETVDVTRVEGIEYNKNYNYFVSNSSASVDYFTVEAGYIYTVTNNTGSVRFFGTSEQVPAYQVPNSIIVQILPGESYSFIVNSSNLNYYSYAWGNALVSVTREKVPNMDGAIGSLVDNVGPQQLWSVFENGIDFVGVVVLVAFGLFLIVLLIKKLSKGKSDF